MAVNDYTQKIDTLTTVAIDEATKDLANLVTEGGEKVLKKMQSKGRIFMVNDAEKVKHPVLFGSGNTLYFDPDNLTGATDTDALNSAANEILGYAQFMMCSGTRNINYPQAMPAGNHIPYISSTIKMHMMDILNKEEKLFLRGEDSGSGTEAIKGCLASDTGYSAGTPFSLPAMVQNDSGNRFAGIEWNDTDMAHWRPGHQVTADANPDTLVLWGTELDEAIQNASYSETERPDWILTTQAVYSALLNSLRDKSQINDAVLANMGTTSEIPYAGAMIDWSRYLDADGLYDISGGVALNHPIVGINTNSLRLNVVAGGGVSEEKLGFVQKVGTTQTHSDRTNLFDRVQYKRCWSVDGGRRSFFSIEGLTLS